MTRTRGAAVDPGPSAAVGREPRQPVIRLEQVSKRFDDHVAVAGVNFAIEPGEFFALLGPSGCGKTTTLRMIAGFETPSAGVVRLDGVDVSKTPPHERNVNTVFQHYALFPHMTVWDNVAFGPRSRKHARAEVKRRVEESLDVVRLTEFAMRKPAQLSGGQQQRVALARALVNRPSALLLDEPLGALDLKLRQVMQFELKRIQREVGIAFVYVTHDQDEALTMSDRIAVMNSGAVEQIGSPAEIYGRPRSEFVASFIGHANLWHGRHRGVFDGRAQLFVLGTTLAAPPGEAAIRPGEPIALVVRPERIRISLEPPGGDVVAVAATVVDLTFQGPVVRLQLAAVDGSAILAHVHPDQELPMLRPGDRVHAHWTPDASLVLPGTAAPATASPDDLLDDPETPVGSPSV